MRKQSNGKLWLYVILAIVLIAVLWGVSREIPFTPETVEQPLENTFAD